MSEEEPPQKKEAPQSSEDESESDMISDTDYKNKVQHIHDQRRDTTY
jgi:hypothetical protein